MLDDATILSEEDVNISMDDEEKRKRSDSDAKRRTFFKFKTKKLHDETVLQYDPAPYTMQVHTPIAKVHFLFSMLSISHAFIIDKGKLVGVLVKKDLINAKL
jgi:signal-transduction protein with cAMP-binding, CBS, and nucleotidyltransferase domain